MKTTVDYSELSTYEYSPADHYKKYCLAEELEYSPEQQRRMTLGSIVGDYIDNPNDDFVKRMKEAGFENGLVLKVQKLYPRIERTGEHQMWLRAELAEGITLVGKLDRFLKDERVIDDYKTTEQEDMWAQWKVDSNRQLSVYDLLFYENFHRPLRELAIAEINLAKVGRFHRWLTSRGPQDRKDTKDWILSLVGKMKQDGIWEQRKSSAEIKQVQAQKRGDTLNL